MDLLMGALALSFFAVAVWFQRHTPEQVSDLLARLLFRLWRAGRPHEGRGVVGVGQSVTHRLPSVEKQIN